MGQGLGPGQWSLQRLGGSKMRSRIKYSSHSLWSYLCCSLNAQFSDSGFLHHFLLHRKQEQEEGIIAWSEVTT